MIRQVLQREGVLEAPYPQIIRILATHQFPIQGRDHRPLPGSNLRPRLKSTWVRRSCTSNFGSLAHLDRCVGTML
jgi:hypothetical protein